MNPKSQINVIKKEDKLLSPDDRTDGSKTRRQLRVRTVKTQKNKAKMGEVDE
jgi:hypothetical protein